MARPLRFVARVALLIALATSVTPLPQQHDSTSRGEDAIASFRPEVRLRKLHLVRPDLIPYPIAYEVCC
jgi:hypothetical protein